MGSSAPETAWIRSVLHLSVLGPSVLKAHKGKTVDGMSLRSLLAWALHDLSIPRAAENGGQGRGRGGYVHPYLR